MSIAVVQSLTPSYSTSAVASLQSGAFSTSPTTGNSIIALIALNGSGAPTLTNVTDTAGNTYTIDGGNGVAQGNVRTVIARASGIQGGSSFKITATPSGNAFITICALEVSGLANNSPADSTTGTNPGSGSSTAVATGSITTTNANDLIIAFANAGAASAWAASPGAPWVNGGTTAIGSNEAASLYYQIVGTTQSGISASWTATGSGNWLAWMVAYKAAYTSIRLPPALLTSGNSTTATGTFTANTGDLVWIDVQSVAVGVPTLTPPTGLTLSLVKQESSTVNAHAVYAGVVSQQIVNQTIGFSGIGGALVAYQVCSIAGAASTIGAAIPQSAINTSNQSSPASSSALSSIAGTSAMIGCFAGTKTSGTTTFGAGANMTALNTNNTTATINLVEYSTALGSPSTTCTATFSGGVSPQIFDVISFEVAVPSAGGGGMIFINRLDGCGNRSLG